MRECMKNAQEHINYESYNDALSSILEAISIFDSYSSKGII